MIPITTTLVISSFIAGIFTFLAPCTFPLIPAYLSFITGSEKPSVWKSLRNGAAFIFGFSSIFILFGAFASQISSNVSPGFRTIITQIIGVVILFWGLEMFGLFKGFGNLIRWYPKWRGLPSGKVWSSGVMGGMLAIGWTPCIGPILGTILTIVWNSSQIWTGVLLMGVFSLGFSVPFLIVAIIFGLSHERIDSLQLNFDWTQKVTGFVLVGVGLLFITNQFEKFSFWIFENTQFINYQEILDWL